MKTKRTVTQSSTKKNKRTMSGGKGIISTYTRRFKDCYKKFIRISDTDDTTKIKKLEAWGGLTGIYKFLEVNKKTFKNTTGLELSALKKMKENIENTTNSSNKDGYIRAIECLEEDGDKILLKNGCVSYDVFVNGGDAVADVDTGAAVTSDVVKGDSDTNNTPAVTSSNKTPEGSPSEDKPVQNQNGPYDPTSGDVEASGAIAEAPAAAAASVVADDVESGANAKADDTGANAGESGATAEVADAHALDAVLGSTESKSGSETESPQLRPLSSGSEEHGGGGSKRRPKSSRRVKFGKSKKGRTTRRIIRKHRR